MFPVCMLSAYPLHYSKGFYSYFTPGTLAVVYLGLISKVAFAALKRYLPIPIIPPGSEIYQNSLYLQILGYNMGLIDA